MDFPLAPAPPAVYNADVERHELSELHYITPICNVASILRHGIRSHKLAERLRHQTVAMEEIQARRANVAVPGGRRLHEYVNLYICARNPMLRKRKDLHENLCVLRVAPEVLDLPNVIVTDQNAASRYVRFAQAPDGLAIVNKDMVFAEWWKHPEDRILEWRHISMKCAEVLVPECVDAEFIRRAYVSGQVSKGALEAVCPGLVAEVNAHMFFM